MRRRPVDRIAVPLVQMGARIEAREGRFAPFTVHGAPRKVLAAALAALSQEGLKVIAAALRIEQRVGIEWAKSVA